MVRLSNVSIGVLSCACHTEGRENVYEFRALTLKQTSLGDEAWRKQRTRAAVCIP